MKIGIVTSFPPSKVTLNEYAYHLVKNFVVKEEIEEVVLFCDITKEDKTLDFPYSEKVTVVECWKFNSYTSLFGILKSIKTYNPNHILFNLQFMKFGDKKIVAALGLMLPMLTRILGVKNTVLIHNILETVDLSSAGFTNNKVLKVAYNIIGYGLTKLILCANQVAVTIPKYKRILDSKYKASNIVHIPHGTFEIPEQPNYRVKSDKKQVMAFGKFGTYKKVENLIEAVIRVRQRIKEDIEVVIAGTSNPNTPTYLSRVEERCKNLNFIRFTGYVEEEEVKNIFNQASIVAFPYTSTTGSSGVLHQAGSYGKATILPNIGDLKELITDEGYTGEFFEPTSIESLANAIQNLVLNDVKRIQLGKQNYRAATAYPMSRICDMYIETFNKNNFITDVVTL